MVKSIYTNLPYMHNNNMYYTYVLIYRCINNLKFQLNYKTKIYKIIIIKCDAHQTT